MTTLKVVGELGGVGAEGARLLSFPLREHRSLIRLDLEGEGTHGAPCAAAASSCQTVLPFCCRLCAPGTAHARAVPVPRAQRAPWSPFHALLRELYRR